jgi:hypothetical protein
LENALLEKLSKREATYEELDAFISQYVQDTHTIVKQRN